MIPPALGCQQPPKSMPDLRRKFLLSFAEREMLIRRRLPRREREPGKKEKQSAQDDAEKNSGDA